MKTAIIGAGWAGLSAAIELTGAGANVTVFEASRQPGGRARSLDWNGCRVDNGQHLLIGAYRHTLDLMARIGVAESLLERRPLQLVGERFSLDLPRWPAPWHLAAGVLLARGLGLAGKIRAALFMQAVKSRAYQAENANQTVSQLLDQHRQRGRIRTHLWESLCVAALNTPPAQASAQLFLNVLRDSLGGERHATDLLLPATNLGALFPQPAVRWLKQQGTPVHFGQRIRTLSFHGDRWYVDKQPLDHEPFDHVILATAPRHASQLLSRLEGPNSASAQALAAQIVQLGHQPIATLYLALGDGIRLPLPLMQLECGPGQWVFDRGQLDAPPGTLAVVISAQGEWESLDSVSLRQAVLEQLRPWLGPDLRVQAHQLIHDPHATFSANAGLVRPGTETPLPGLWLAGDYVDGPYPATLEGAVQSGQKAAQALIDFINLK